MRPIFALLLAPALAAQDDMVFRAGVALVHVDASVAAQNGRLIDGLTKEDFRILDNRKEQPIVHFAAGEEALDLVLLFDISTSMRPAVQAVATAAREGLRELREGDRAAVMVFHSRSRVLAPFTTNLEDVARSIEKDLMSLKFFGGTHIQSAAEDAAKLLMNQPRTRRRRAVLVITDNFGQRTRKEATVVGSYWEADAVLSGLIVRNAGNYGLQTLGSILMPASLAMHVGAGGIAEKTGGDMIKGSDPGAAFRDAIHRIRSRYSLYYSMPQGTKGEQRSIHVELTRATAGNYPKARVRARTGYTVQ